MATRLNGKVLWFNSKKGYGFVRIISAGEHFDENVFVHYSELIVQKSEYKYLITGEYVSLDLVESNNEKYKYQASQVSGIDTEGSTTRNLLICDSRAEEEENVQKKISSNPNPPQKIIKNPLQPQTQQKITKPRKNPMYK
jgi:cold shock CspA family protein